MFTLVMGLKKYFGIVDNKIKEYNFMIRSKWCLIRMIIKFKRVIIRRYGSRDINDRVVKRAQEGLLFKGGALYKTVRNQSIFDNIIPFLRAINWRNRLSQRIITFSSTIRFISR
jgi:hypothetical protein